MKKLVTFLVIAACPNAFAQTISSMPLYRLDSEVISYKMMKLINPQNIKSIHVEKKTQPAEIQITLKEYKFINLNQIRSELKLSPSQHPVVMIGGEEYESKDIMLDASLHWTFKFIPPANPDDEGIIKVN